jgi:peroxiredoxin
MNGCAIFLAAVALAFLLLFPTPPAGAVNLLPGEPAPEFSLPDIDGKTVTLSQFRDRTVLIAFWSTWCSRCTEELTFLRDTFGGRDDVVVLLVNQDSDKTLSPDRIVELREKLSLPFPILVDSGLVLWDRFGINALPTSVVIGKDGRIVFAEPNFYWASPEKLLRAVSPG